MVAGEIAIKSQPQDLSPFATTIVERLVPILAAPAGSMPRSIIENRSAAPPQCSVANLGVFRPQPVWLGSSSRTWSLGLPV